MITMQKAFFSSIFLYMEIRTILACDRQKALKNGQQDHLTNTKVLYIYVFCFFQLNLKKSFDV